MMSYVAGMLLKRVVAHGESIVVGSSMFFHLPMLHAPSFQPPT